MKSLLHESLLLLLPISLLHSSSITQIFSQFLTPKSLFYSLEIVNSLKHLYTALLKGIFSFVLGFFVLLFYFTFLFLPLSMSLCLLRGGSRPRCFENNFTVCTLCNPHCCLLSCCEAGKACWGGVASIQVMQPEYLSNRITISFWADRKSNDKSNVRNNNSPKQQHEQQQQLQLQLQLQQLIITAIECKQANCIYNDKWQAATKG